MDANELNAEGMGTGRSRFHRPRDQVAYLFSALVPKLHLGMPLSWQLHCPSAVAKELPTLQPCRAMELRPQVRSQIEFGNEDKLEDEGDAERFGVRRLSAAFTTGQIRE